MNIFWHGKTCFKILAQKERNEQISILIDIFEKETGLRPPKAECDILLLTQEGGKKESAGFVVSNPGEYDIKGVSIQGLLEKPGSKKTIYTIETEDIKICHFGSSSQKELTSEQVERIGEVDILMIPVGGGEGLEAQDAIKIVSQLEPKITIPMNYKIPGLGEKLDEVGKFLKILGIKSLESLPKLSIKKKDLTEDEAKIIVLTP